MGKKFDPNVVKVQLKLAVSRLKLQKTKKDNIIKNQKREVADLLRQGKEESARIKVENIIREDFIIEAYEILELFCELILARLGVIQISKECPPDMKEAICTIIYAAPRSEAKELIEIRNQLIAKYGPDLATCAAHNHDGCVNSRVVHKLSLNTPEPSLVFQYLNEIAKQHDIDWCADIPTPIPQPMTMPTHGMGMAQPSSQVGFDGMSFPDPPGTIRGNPMQSNQPSAFPQFPSTPSSGSSASIPTFDPSGLPGGGLNFPPPPTSNSNLNFPTFPSTPSSGTTAPSFPSFPTFPSTPSSASSSNLPTFPTPPTNSGSTSAPSFPTFPSPPGNTTSAPSFPTFPTPPGNTSSPSFPSTPSNNSGSTGGFPSFPSPPSSGTSDNSVPDFDDLTARFEKLKKK
eukprot:TRINITY_DN1424_c0_g1_i2.p1 TRINITY_DN1424_c0_g1~~TRINITY_DN1424_c0_g1_i2.p1  ORF type:complete len:401 (+),score=96.65 TRINITY_DN1424_c0_g1_i2:174-1376(+)